MKKILSFVLICVLLLSALLLPSCGSKETPPKTPSSSEANPTLDKENENGNEKEGTSDPTPSAPVGSQGLAYAISSDGRRCSITGIGTCTDTELRIPPFINGVPVVEIAEGAFRENKEIVSVTIPEQVKTIGSSAFSDCSALRSIQLHDGISQIGSQAFLNTAYYNDTNNWENHVLYIGNHLIVADSGLKTDVYGGTCDYAVKEGTKCIAAYALAWSGVTSVTIPKSVEYVNERAFQACAKLSSVSIEEGGSIHLGGYLFYDCPLKTISLPTHVARIEKNAFVNCTYYKTTSNWSDNVLYIGSHLIYAKKTSASYSIRNGTTTIADYAFENGDMLETVSIPNTVTVLGAYAFCTCSKLTSVTLPDSLTVMGGYAFLGCRQISSITIPKNVTEIEEGAFYGIPSVSLSPENKSYSMVQGCLIDPKNKLLLLGSDTATIPNDGSVTAIAERAFFECAELTSITVPNAVTRIGSYAFQGCVNLSKVVLPDHIQYIGEGLFSACGKLNSFTLPSHTKVIGNYAFSDCASLEAITLPNSLTTLGISAFEGCKSLSSIRIPNNVTSIAHWAFYDCSQLSTVLLPASITSIETSAFELPPLTLKTLYYAGTESDWSKIVIGSENNCLNAETLYYYSEERPLEAGNYWRYVNGVPTVWEAAQA